MNMNINNIVQEVAENIQKETERVMLDQLGELVSRNLIRWEKSPIQVFQEANMPAGKFKIGFGGRFVLKDQEYIKELEAQNDSLRAQLDYQLPRKPERR